MNQHFEYTTITIKVKGARSGVFSYYQRKSVDDESFAHLERMGRDGWELIAVIPVSHGAVGAQVTDAAICFLKRTRTRGGQPAAVPREEARSATELAPARSDFITGQQFDALIARDRLKKVCATDNYWLTEQDWNFITVNRAPEALPVVERLIEHLTSEQDSETLRSQRQTFYGNLLPNEAAESLYMLAANPKCFHKVHDILKSLGLFDVCRIKGMLESPERSTRLNALHLVWLQKSEYTADDGEQFEDLVGAVTAAFPMADLVEKKGLLGKVKRVWRCPNCSSESDAEATACVCGSDRYGVTAEHGGRQSVLERLERRKAVLQSARFDL